MRFTTRCDDGAEIEFECADTVVSRRVSEDILRGQTYPWLPFIGDVEVVLDAGANCGAASIYFAHHCPDARIHAFEPGFEQRAILDRNTADYPNVSVHPFGLFSEDRAALLYRGRGDTGHSSVFPSDRNVEVGDEVALRSAGAWVAEQGIGRIDLLKVDVEGCEVEVLSSLASLLPAVKALYVEYDLRRNRRDIDALVRETHELYIGRVLLDQGELVYLRADLAEITAATDFQAELLRRSFAAAAG